MKKALMSLAKFIPVALIIIVLISTLTGFKAEMFVSECASSLRTDEPGGNKKNSGEGHICAAPLVTFQLNQNQDNQNNQNNQNNNQAITSLYNNPLTGLNTIDDISLNRPVAVSINNQRDALPTNATNGISQADIVYELLVESGITRLVALYQDFSSVGVVGSIRSVRHYTVEIAEAYNAILVHTGGSPLGLEEIEKRNITSLDEISGKYTQLFKRDTGRVPGEVLPEYQSVTTNGLSVSQWLSASEVKKTHDNNYKHALTFTDNPIPNGEKASTVDVKFSSVKSSSFTYDAARKIYNMSQYGSQFKDANNNSPVAFTNLLILEVPITDLVGHGEGSGRQDMNTVGSGKGYFISGGQYVQINWLRASKSSQFTYTLENGNPLELGQGKTYIGLVPPDMNISFN